MNAASWIILAVIVAVVALVIVKVVRDRKSGASACEYCASSSSCPVHAAGDSCRHPVKHPVQKQR